MHGKRMTEALNEVRSFRDATNEGGPGSGPQKGGKKFSDKKIKQAYGILNDPRYKQGNYTGAAKAINKLAPGLADHPDVKNAMKRANEELEEENRFSRQLKGRQREVYDLALKDIRKNKVYGEKDQDAVVDKVAGTSLMGNSLSDVKRAIQHESLDLSATGDTTTSNASLEDEQVELDKEWSIMSERTYTMKYDVATGKPFPQKPPFGTDGGNRNPYTSGRAAAKAGKKYSDNPHKVAVKKLHWSKGYVDYKKNPGKYEEVEEELIEAKFTPAQVSALKKAYGNFSSTGVSAKQMNKLRDLMKTYSKDHLDQLAVLDIPMVSKMAKELL